MSGDDRLKQHLQPGLSLHGCRHMGHDLELGRSIDRGHLVDGLLEH
jgi:hypothetical protein